MRTMRDAFVAVAVAVALAVVVAACGAPVPPSVSALFAPDASAAAGAITEAGLRAQLDGLAAAAGGSAAYRALGGTGYDAAAELVSARLRAAGWTVTEDRFTTPAFADDGGSTLVVGGRTFGAGEVNPLIFAPAGTADGPVVAIDRDPNATGPGTTGCLESDYGRLPPRAIVLVRSGPCNRRNEVLAAQEAGAAGFVAVIANAHAGAVLRPTLIAPDGLAIPVAAVSIDAARAMADAAAAGGTARLETHARTWQADARTIIAELPGETAESVVMLGAHLDSVIDGPGLNDDGSGVAAVLEIARALGGTRPRATIRLAFWAGEEEGLKGSAHYVEGQDQRGRGAIVAYLNADMIGSPNGFAGVYDEGAAPVGSSAIRVLLMTGLQRLGGTPIGVDTGGGSDHVPFQQAGILTGGVFSGASEILTPGQAATFGGTTGAPADACYHLTCDGMSNVNLPLARLLAAGLADLTVRLANGPELVRR